MQAGNVHYNSLEDLPDEAMLFVLSGALLLPGGRMPLNVFEPRYLEMIDLAMATDRHIGMVQPKIGESEDDNPNVELCEVGCLGRITAISETGDGRYVMQLEGISRFRIDEELAITKPFRKARLNYFAGDLIEGEGNDEVDREALLTTFQTFLTANDMEADWDSIEKAQTSTLVNALSMLSPYGPAEKQALLEAPDLKTRSETLIAITEISLARDDENNINNLQ